MLLLRRCALDMPYLCADEVQLDRYKIILISCRRWVDTMPIYEFLCTDCNILFNFYSSRVNTSKIPDCPQCQEKLKKQMSSFSTIGQAKEQEDIMPDFDERKMEKVLGELAHEAENVNEDDPQHMARIMRKFTEQSGMSLGDGMEEALCRMESGEDPDKIEQEMGDLLEGEDPFAVKLKKASLAAKKRPPVKDETLYDL